MRLTINVKSTVRILSILVAILENMNFKCMKALLKVTDKDKRPMVLLFIDETKGYTKFFRVNIYMYIFFFI